MDELYKAVVHRRTVTSRLMFINLLDPDCFEEFDEDERTRGGSATPASGSDDMDATPGLVEMDHVGIVAENAGDRSAHADRDDNTGLTPNNADPS